MLETHQWLPIRNKITKSKIQSPCNVLQSSCHLLVTASSITLPLAAASSLFLKHFRHASTLSLCTCCSLSLECFSPRCPHASFSSLLKRHILSRPSLATLSKIYTTTPSTCTRAHRHTPPIFLLCFTFSS